MKPKKVREQAERAKKLQEDLIRRKKGEVVSPDEASDPIDPSTATPPLSGQPQNVDTGGDDDFLPPVTGDEGADPDEGPVAGERLLPDPTPAAAAPDQDEWKHKYSVLQGKYNSEMSEMRSRVQMLETLLATMNNKPSTTDGNGLDPKADEIIATLKDQYPDIADAIVAVVESRIKQVTPRIEQRVGSLENQASKTREDAFYDALDRAIPGWEKVNVHPVFLSWLAEIDDMSGQKKSELLRVAYSALDPRRVTNIFIRFRNEKGWVKVEPKVGQRMAADSRAGASVDVHPNSSGSGGPPPSRRQAKKPLLRTEIAKFYDDVRRGKYRTRPKEKAAFEAEMALAVKEGRVR